VVPEKRKLMVVSGAIAAAFMLPGCAPAGYNGGSSGFNAGAAAPAANSEKVEAAPSASASGDANANSDANAGSEANAAQANGKELTTELNAKEVARMGQTVQDQGGWVLYRFDSDKVNQSSACEGDCAKIWPPALTSDGNAKLSGIDKDKVGTIDRKDGTKQLTIGGWPVYRYIGDKKPGQWKGQNVGGKWFVVDPQGKKNLTCLPPVSKPVAPPADDKGGDKSADQGGDKSGSGGSGSDYSY
jgi:predicted lipoprotein with Yx(FWY)xxD motif